MSRFSSQPVPPEPSGRIGQVLSILQVGNDDPAMTTTASRRRKTHGYDHSKPTSMLDGAYVESTASSRQAPWNNPTTDDLRRIRSEFYKRSPEDRRREVHREMDPHTIQRRHSRPRKSSTRVADTSIRELQRDHDTRHRYRREKYEEEPDEGTGYVYKQAYRDTRGTDDTMPIPRRRASAPRATTRYETERAQVQEPGLARRHTERRVVSRREAGVESSRIQRRSDHDAATPRTSMTRYVTANLPCELLSTC